MTISSALNAGVAGLNANATRLATISDNIANSSTFGYKRADAEFANLVIGGGSGSGVYSAGGVRASSYRLIEERGSLVGTSNALDLAISGRGMLPVTDEAQAGDFGGDSRLMLTRTGSFHVDESGVLRNGAGLALLGWPVDANGNVAAHGRDSISGLEPVVVNANQMAGYPTSQMTLGLNLPATATNAGAEGAALSTTVEYFGNLGTSESLTFSFTPVVPATGSSNRWTLQIRDSASADAVIGEYSLEFDGSRAAGGTLQSVTTVSGGAYDAATGTVELTVAGGPLTLSLNKPGDPAGLTQLSDTFAPTQITKDGSPAGEMNAVTMDEEGFIVATYNTGFTRRLYQIPVVDVPNANGLTSLSNQAYTISNTSGAFYLWDAGDGPTGTIEGYAMEGSTTDVANELTSLIETQRAYSSNAKVIQTVDEMLQETTNIKR